MTITRIERLLQETGSNAEKLIVGLKDQKLQWDDCIRTVEVNNIVLDDSGNPIGKVKIDGIVIRVMLQRDLHPYWVDNSGNPPP